MDGRYKEQKTRLSHCGLPRKLYLIEETATSSGREAWQGHSNQASGGQALNRESLEQAISNTCVRDGFTVRRCRSPKECVEFLAALTDVLTEKYSGKRLHKRKLMEPHHPDDCHLPTLAEFHEFSRTDKPLVIREIFCNMLVTMKGGNRPNLFSKMTILNSPFSHQVFLLVWHGQSLTSIQLQPY